MRFAHVLQLTGALTLASGERLPCKPVKNDDEDARLRNLDHPPNVHAECANGTAPPFSCSVLASTFSISGSSVSSGRPSSTLLTGSTGVSATVTGAFPFFTDGSSNVSTFGISSTYVAGTGYSLTGKVEQHTTKHYDYTKYHFFRFWLGTLNNFVCIRVRNWR